MIANIQAGAGSKEDSAASPVSQLFADALDAIFQTEGQLAINQNTEASRSSTKSGKSESSAKSEDTPADSEAGKETVPAISVPIPVPAAVPVVNSFSSATAADVPANSAATATRTQDLPAIAPPFAHLAADQEIATETNMEEPAQKITPAETPDRGSGAEFQQLQQMTDRLSDPALIDAHRSTAPDKPEALSAVDPQQEDGGTNAPEISLRKRPEPIVLSLLTAKPDSAGEPAQPRIAPKAGRKIEPKASTPSSPNAIEVAPSRAETIPFYATEPALNDQAGKAAMLSPQPQTSAEPAAGLDLGEVPTNPRHPASTGGELPPDVQGNLAPEKTLKSADEQLVLAQSQQKTARVQPMNDRVVEAVPNVTANHFSSESGSTPSKQNQPAPSETAPSRMQEPLSPQFNDLRSEPGAVHLVSKLEHQEMRFGWNSQNFGRIEIRTTLEHDRVGAVVSVPDAHLRDSLQAEIGSLNRALAGHSLELSQFTAFDSSTSRDPNREQDSRSRNGSPLWNAKERNQVPSPASTNVIRAHAGLLDLRA